MRPSAKGSPARTDIEHTDGPSVLLMKVEAGGDDTGDDGGGFWSRPVCIAVALPVNIGFACVDISIVMIITF
jgi:hypothetical protein